MLLVVLRVPPSVGLVYDFLERCHLLADFALTQDDRSCHDAASADQLTAILTRQIKLN